LVDGPAGPAVVGINIGTYVQSRVLTQKGQVIHRSRSESIANTAVATAAFQAAVRTFPEAEILGTRAELRALQGLLAELGHFHGRKDGRFGRESRAAITSFERAGGLPVTGLATTSLLKRLTDMRLEARAADGPTLPDRLETGALGQHRQSRSR
jgi:protease YdgD